MEPKKLRIGISGVSSTGKSTLAKAVAEAVNMPLILDKDLHEKTFQYMEELGIAPHTRYFPEQTPQEDIDFERAVLTKRVELEDACGSFVADESPLDYLNYIYIMCCRHPKLISSSEVEDMVGLMTKRLETYHLIWYLPFGVLPTVDDGRRHCNIPLLRHWNYALQGLLADHQELLGSRLRVMPKHAIDLGLRTKMVRDSIIGHGEYPEIWS